MKSMQQSLFAHRLPALCLASSLLWLGVPGVCKAQTQTPIEAQDKVEPAPTSRLTGIALPISAMRLLDKRLLDQITPKLQQLAQQSKKRSADPEVLIWSGSGFVGENAPTTIAAVAAQIKKAGYVYIEKETALQKGVGRVVLAQKQGQQVAGFWFGTDTTLCLAWSRMEGPGAEEQSPSRAAVKPEVSSTSKASARPEKADAPAARPGAGAGANAEAEAMAAIHRIYKVEMERLHDLAHYDFDQAFAYYDPGYTFTNDKGKVLTLKEQRQQTEQFIHIARKMTQEIHVEKGHLAGSTLEVTYRATVDCEVPAPDNPAATTHLRDEGLYLDTWKRTGNGWRLQATHALADQSGGSAKSGGDKPKFKQQCTQQEANMYKLLSTALASRGYTANVNGTGVLACYNSVGTKLFTLPPRRACSDMFQYYVEKSLTLQIKTQVNLEASLTLRGGHRGFSTLLNRDVFFEGTSPYEAQNTIRFVYSDTYWD